MENNFYKDKTILVTGGAGSIGSEIVRTLIKHYSPKAVRAFDNNETGLFDLEQKLRSNKLRLHIGDIRDRERLKKSIENVDIVFHTAALKHVPLCEYNPFETVKTNVVGTQNVIDACLNANVKKMINISTDKAVNPVSVMGATKLLTEKLTTVANYYKGRKQTILSSVRFGNVLNSRGSVVSVFHQQIKKGGPVTVTNPEMKRFVMSIPKAVDLIFKAAEISEGGEIFILKMPIVRLGDVAEVMIEQLAGKYGYKQGQIKIKIVGEREGEKLEEELIARNELKNTYETKNMFIILDKKQNKQKKKYPYIKSNSYLKSFSLLTKKEIKKLINDVLNFSEKPL